MMYFIAILRSALNDFGKNKGRTFLTSLGIMIGVLSVVLLIAAGVGLKEFIKNQFESLGTNLLYVVPGGLFNSSGGFNSGAQGSIGPTFQEKDVVALKRLDNVRYVTPIYSKSTKVSVDGKTEIGTIYGTNEEIFPARNLKAEFGDSFSAADNSSRNKVVVMGPKIAEKLFGTASLAVGRKVRMEGLSFKVIGVLESKGGGGLGGPDFDSFVYMPYKTAYIFNTDKKFVQVLIGVVNGDAITSVKEAAKTDLLKRYKEDEFSVIESTEILNAIGSIFNILNSVLIAIAAISLVVGGIGILNIMYVTVSERIKEIGIRRALGARRNDILWQFLIEATVLSVFGGLLGLIIASLLVLAVQRFFPARITWESVALALGTSSAIGIIFGVFPAKKAADLSPIDAIRYE